MRDTSWLWDAVWQQVERSGLWSDCPLKVLRDPQQKVPRSTRRKVLR